MKSFFTTIKAHFWLLVVLCLFVPLLTFNLLQVPRGLTVDEAAFGYNAALLAHTGHDENGRFMPIFVLSIDGKDWRQPVTQYYQALFFKIFGASVFNLRLTSVVLTLFTAILIYVLIDFLFSSRFLSVLSIIFYLTVPIVFIQSHLALDNNMVIPFTILWILGLLKFIKTKKISWLVLSAVSLGVGFYTYKGMRAVVPVWSALSCLYLWKTVNFKAGFRFALFILPFYAVIPLLQHYYPGAILDNQHPHLMVYYDFLYPYISAFDPGFLFITGDATPFHSTSHHGMFLLATLPLFLAGLYYCLKKSSRFGLVLLAFFTAPALMGFVDSVHRASRTMCLVPFFIVIITAGLVYLWEMSQNIKIALVILLFLIVANFYDFFNFYHHDYALVTQGLFGNLDYYQSFIYLQKESADLHLRPAISRDLFNSFGITGKFYEAVYFPSSLIKYQKEEDLPSGTIIMSYRQNVPGLTQITRDDLYYFHQLKN